MTILISSMQNFFKRLSLSFTKESGLAGFFFFLVLCSWYILRPVRNEMAVQNSDILPYLLGVGAFVMLLLNPIYSWLASRRNLKGVLVGCYSFFILNLLVFISLWKFFNLSSAIWLSQIFYVWCNVYSFFVVSIIFFTLISIIFLILALVTGLILLKRFTSLEEIDKAAGGTSFDALKNLISSSQIRSIGLYMYLWTGMMTIHWVTSIDIVNAWSSDGGNRIIFFSKIEQTVTILTLFTQFFLTSAIIRFAGPKAILMFYGFLFMAAFIGYYLNPTIGYVFVITIILRLFEYGINKPTREVVFSYLKRTDRYKSTVMVDTFLVRMGDFSGSGFILLSKSFGVAFSQVPLLAIPFAACITMLGYKIPPKETIIN
jgi:AAA family ATP:ADP antiporter